MAQISRPKKKRAVLYLRQSTFREESISLELQETAGREYCAQHGYKVIAVEADPGISGRTWNRPAVKRVMEMVEAGKADVIVLWKWSRLSRSRRDWAVAVDRVEVAGGMIESATEPLDTATSTGRLARGLMVEFAAFESERIGDVWKEAHQRRVKSGRPANGKARWGYVYDKDAKIHRPDPELREIVAQTYARYNAGESIYSLTAWLNGLGVKTAGGYGPADSPRLWSHNVLRRMLLSGFAAGYFKANGELHKGIHEPIIDQATWEAFLVANERRAVRRDTPRSTYLLSGMVRCGICGYKMSAGQFGSGGVPQFRCKGASSYRLHSGGYVAERVILSEVLEWLKAQPLAEQHASLDDDSGEDLSLSRKLREIEGINQKIRRLSDQLVEDLIPKDVYREMVEEATKTRDDLEREILRLKVQQRAPAKATIIANLLRDWDILPVSGLRTLLQDVIEEVEVIPQRPQSRVLIKPVKQHR